MARKRPLRLRHRKNLPNRTPPAASGRKNAKNARSAALRAAEGRSMARFNPQLRPRAVS